MAEAAKNERDEEMFMIAREAIVDLMQHLTMYMALRVNQYHLPDLIVGICCALEFLCNVHMDFLEQCIDVKSAEELQAKLGITDSEMEKAEIAIEAAKIRHFAQRN